MNRVKELRKEMRLTQTQLANGSGVNRSTISMIESGKRKPSYTTAKKLANILGVEWPELMEVNGGRD